MCIREIWDASRRSYYSSCFIVDPWLWQIKFHIDDYMDDSTTDLVPLLRKSDPHLMAQKHADILKKLNVKELTFASASIREHALAPTS